MYDVRPRRKLRARFAASASRVRLADQLSFGLCVVAIALYGDVELIATRSSRARRWKIADAGDLGLSHGSPS